jgi:hypothetical protein
MTQLNLQMKSFPDAGKSREHTQSSTWFHAVSSVSKRSNPDRRSQNGNNRLLTASRSTSSQFRPDFRWQKTNKTLTVVNRSVLRLSTKFMETVGRTPPNHDAPIWN